MIAKRLILAVNLCMLSLMMFSQVEETVVPGTGAKKQKSEISDRWNVGLDFGLSFGSITYIKLAPDISYRFNSRLTAGLGPIYIYENYKYYGVNTSTFGGKVLTSFAIFRSKEHGGLLSIGDIVFHLENEYISIEKIYVYPGTPFYENRGRTWIDNFLVGGGLVQPISGRMNVALYLLWDLSQNLYTPYTNPIFKFGFYYSL
jgi:hypothetical protein